MNAPGKPLAGRIILVTGSTGGIGLETARLLSAMGAHLVLGARDASRGREVEEELQHAGASAELLPIDLGSFSSVREAAARLTGSHPRLDVLVNNAGVAVKERRETADGHEVTWETNFLGPFLLTRLLLPALEKAERPRVVNVSSVAHANGRLDWNDLELSRAFKGFQAYANSKLALMLFSRELSRRHPAVAANAVHPGAIATGIWRALPKGVQWVLRLILPSSRRGARPVVRLAAAPELEGVTGRYFDKMREAEPAPVARSDADAARLWEVAEKATA